MRRTVLAKKLERAERLLAEAREMQTGGDTAYADLQVVSCLRRLESTIDDAVTDAVGAVLRNDDASSWEQIGAALGNQKDRDTPMNRNNARAWCVNRGLVA